MINRSEKPKAVKDIYFELPEIKEFRLKNNLRVLFVHKNNLPILQLNLITESGSKFDPTSKKGLAYLTAQLIDEGAGKYNALELDEEFDLLGTAFNTSLDNDNVMLNLLTLQENFERSLELLSLIITEPNFSDQDFIREHAKLITKLIQSKTQPAVQANKAFDKIIYQENPYSFPTSGLENDVKLISNYDVKSFYNKYYSPNKSCLIVVGNINENDLLYNLNKHLSNWNSTSNFAVEISIPQKEKTKVYIVDKKDSPQTEIRIGHLSTKRKTKDYYAKVIMNTILGGQFSSRINLNLREDKGYTYGAHSGFSYNKVTSHFIVSTSVETKFTKNSVDEILKELKAIKVTISDEEIEFAKSYLTKRFPAMFETFNNVARNLSTLVIHDLPFEYYNNYLSNLSSVTRKEVEEAAANNIFEDNCAIILVGDEKSIRDQFNDYGYEIELLKL